MPSSVRKSFMATCPWINGNVKRCLCPCRFSGYNLAFLDYVCDIAQAQKSIVYLTSFPSLPPASSTSEKLTGKKWQTSLAWFQSSVSACSIYRSSPFGSVLARIYFFSRTVLPPMRTTIASFVTFNPRRCQRCARKINICVSPTMHRSRAPNFTLSE